MRPYAFVPIDGRDATHSPLELSQLLADPRIFPMYAFDENSIWSATHLGWRQDPSLATFRAQVTICDVRVTTKIDDDPDILVLHYVSDDILVKLLRSRNMRARFAFCTFGSGSVLEREHNTVVFSSRSFPFTWSPSEACNPGLDFGNTVGCKALSAFTARSEVHQY